jgi:glycosyltransferase involved in cell wall biosynthesis
MTDLLKVTLFVYAYNHAEFIAEAIEAALNQSYPNLEIILSDDNSTDGTFEIMESKAKAYQGSHKIILNKNENNLGITGHLNKIMTMGTGDWFVLGAGDDISFPDRVERIVHLIQNKSEIMAFNSGFEIIDQFGTVSHYHGFNIDRLYVTGASGAWNRKLFDFFGPITQPTTAEDVVIPFRALLLGKLMLLNDATIYYREHKNSISNPLNTKHIEAQKHLSKICTQLINACEQRVLDIEKAESHIPNDVFSVLKLKHGAIIELLKERKISVEKTIQMLESPNIEKIKYLFTTTNIKKHSSFSLRMKQILLSSDILGLLNKKRGKHQQPKSYNKTLDTFTLDINELVQFHKDVLIYL